MNKWAKTDELGGHGTFDRRVYRREFADALGFGVTWFRRLQKLGAIPPGRRDRGGKRLWWLESEVRETLGALTQSAQRGADTIAPEMAHEKLPLLGAKATSKRSATAA